MSGPEKADMSGPGKPDVSGADKPDVSGPAKTERLLLAVPERDDLDELHELYADPRVWRDDPVARHATPGQTAAMIDRWRASWQRDGLGMWVARSAGPAGAGRLVGIGGTFIRYGVAWNLGFRLSPAFWGGGYAQEITRAAFEAAQVVRPELPMTAYLLEGNLRSQRATERTGLRRVWRGPDAGNPDPRAVRLLYADRDLPSTVVQTLTER
jgi:RimJ/RimL family protein N-acetyltransferase